MRGGGKPQRPCFRELATRFCISYENFMRNSLGMPFAFVSPFSSTLLGMCLALGSAALAARSPALGCSLFAHSPLFLCSGSLASYSLLGSANYSDGLHSAGCTGALAGTDMGQVRCLGPPPRNSTPGMGLKL